MVVEEAPWLATKKNILRSLNEQYVEFTFTKKDGSTRVMVGVPFNSDEFPKTQEAQDKKKRRPAPDYIFHVYERDIGWRSFDLRDLISYKVL
jgi:hypothetical protein